MRPCHRWSGRRAVSMRINKFIKVLTMTLPLLLSTFGCGNTGVHRTASPGSNQDNEDAMNITSSTCVSSRTKPCPVVKTSSVRRGGAPAPAPAPNPAPAPAPSKPVSPPENPAGLDSPVSKPPFSAATYTDCELGQRKCEWNVNNEHTKCIGNIVPSLVDLNDLNVNLAKACEPAARRHDACASARQALDDANKRYSLGREPCEARFFNASASCSYQKTECDLSIIGRSKYIWELD